MQEDIVADKDLLDAGIIFGTGFAPFRGGPMNYSLQEGVDSITQMMTEYESSYGDRFHPVDGWSRVETVIQPRSNLTLALRSDASDYILISRI